MAQRLRPRIAQLGYHVLQAQTLRPRAKGAQPQLQDARLQRFGRAPPLRQVQAALAVHHLAAALQCALGHLCKQSIFLSGDLGEGGQLRARLRRHMAQAWQGLVPQPTARSLQVGVAWIFSEGNVVCCIVSEHLRTPQAKQRPHKDFAPRGHAPGAAQATATRQVPQHRLGLIITGVPQQNVGRAQQGGVLLQGAQAAASRLFGEIAGARNLHGHAHKWQLQALRQRRGELQLRLRLWAQAVVNTDATKMVQPQSGCCLRAPVQQRLAVRAAAGSDDDAAANRHVLRQQQLCLRPRCRVRRWCCRGRTRWGLRIEHLLAVPACHAGRKPRVAVAQRRCGGQKARLHPLWRTC